MRQTGVSLVLTIDTEPDNQWDAFSEAGPGADLKFENTRSLEPFIERLRAQGLVATWLTSYTVARDPASVAVLRRAATGGDEIGGHMHAWETPPFVDADRRARGFIYEYDERTRLQKLQNSTKAVQDAFGLQPLSFRAGRWAVDDIEFENLAATGYRVDTSVVPGHTFHTSRGLTRPGPDFRSYLRGDTVEPFRIGALWEVPVSTLTLGRIGRMKLGSALARNLNGQDDLPRRATRAVLQRAGLNRFVWIRPGIHGRDELIRGANELLDRGASIINIMLHSSETCAGTSPLTRDRTALNVFLDDLFALTKTLIDTRGAIPRSLSDVVGIPRNSAAQCST